MKPLAQPFLQSFELRHVIVTAPAGLSVLGLALGPGVQGLEVLVITSTQRPSTQTLRAVWKARVGSRATPVLIVVLYGELAAICGPVGEMPPLLADVAADKIERLCAAALREPDRHAAIALLKNSLPSVETATAGLRNEGLFATHELLHGVPKREDWKQACAASQSLFSRRGRALLEGLGFALADTSGREIVLRAANTRVALALLLERNESPDVPLLFNASSPVSQALAKAVDERVDFLIVTSGASIRLYPVRPGVGTGQRGRTETFTELNVDLLALEQSGYLFLLFSAVALAPGGAVTQILESSSRYAVGLGSRLRERIYNEVVPQLAQALLEARRIRRPTNQDLRQTYEMALIVLFRLLFIAYAEDKELLPYKTNDAYRQRSLKHKAIELTAYRKECKTFAVGTTVHWEEVERLFRAVDKGNEEWGVPVYNGGLFTSDSEVSAIGALIADISLPDHVFGQVLAALLVDNEGSWGPVDFRSLGVREFGTIYEGLLENELALADADLTTEVKDKQERYRPAGAKDRIVIRRGQAFLHNTSGARKSTGSYFTKDFAVEHLLDKGLEPALVDHFARIDAMSDREAAEAFFDFRIADITMGSGHFLVSALDRIERAFSGYLVRRQLPDVMAELQRLRTSAQQQMQLAGNQAPEIETTQLLRRQIARHCIYGVDINRIAVELARLSLWIHTFIPGLPLSFLDHSLVVGNSLVGIATLEEATNEIRKLLRLPLFDANAEELLEPARESLTRLGRLSDADASEITAARRAASEARGLTRRAAALFDVLTAARVSDEVKSALLQDPAFERDGHIDQLFGSKAHKLAEKTLRELPPFHFPVALPEVFLRERPGFDVIIGNPPWEEATVEENRFWTRHVPGFHSLKQRDREATGTAMRKDRPDLVRELEHEIAEAGLLSQMLLKSPYPGMGTGDPDLYKAACWRFWSLVRSDTGRVSVVLPRSALAGKGSADFRKKLLSSAVLTDVTQLLNKQNWVFPDVHPQYTFALVTWLRKPPIESDLVPLFGPFSSLDRFMSGVGESPARFRASDVLSWTESAMFPLLPTDYSLAVFSQLRTSPRLDTNHDGTWWAVPYRELHATDDKYLMSFVEKQPPGSWPILKGESFDLWVADSGIYYGWADTKETCDVLMARRRNSARMERSAFWGISDTDLHRRETLPCNSPRIGFRLITRATDTRSFRTALLPPETFCSNGAPYFIMRRSDQADEAFLLGVLSSLSLDWYARRFVEVNMNYHVLNPFPIPRPPRSSSLWKRTVKIAGRLAAPDDRFAAWADAVGVEHGPLEDEDKQDKIYELDAVVAHLYGLSEPQLRHIFETFHEGWNFREQLEATLVHFRKWQKAT